MAALFTFNWEYNVSDYDLKQILLQSIPLNFRVIPNPNPTDGTYPSLVDQFTTIQLTSDQIAKKSYSSWIPANVRGNSSTANSITNRYKATAPQGSVFANFVAVNDTDFKKKLDYRVYVGGNDVTNFDVLPNTNYTYQVNFAHTGIPVNDKRVTYIDPIPASQNNNNFVPTANCFMVAPGGSFNFDPTKIRINGSDITNTTLTGWGKVNSVKLLWQTKESGDVGDPVVGIVNSDNDHSNIVEYKSGRIFCRVAANTSGGSGVIAAYDNNNKILWSWHVWVTDYAPDPTGNASVDTPNKGKQKYTYGGANQLPMMDRNLGANAGYTTVPPTELEKSKTNGFHYQWGRKDPFPSSYTEKKLNSITINQNAPTQGMLNLYQPDGVTFFKRLNIDIAPSVQTVYQNPATIYIASMNASSGWCSDLNDPSLVASYVKFWDDTNKGIHDPCPAGWRIPSRSEYWPLFSAVPADNTWNTGTSTNSRVDWQINAQNKANGSSDGGVVVYFEGKNSGRSTFFRLNGYQQTSIKFIFVGNFMVLWARESNYQRYLAKGGAHSFGVCINYPGGLLGDGIYSHIFPMWNHGDAHPVRCIQERQ